MQKYNIKFSYEDNNFERQTYNAIIEAKTRNQAFQGAINQLVNSIILVEMHEDGKKVY